ncbi:MAG: methylmalonyl Co-A mutase-associated GTPase MeaB [Anaerolineales bacterium]|nr:methylmalonyl Co-A mutase-associated GTPase MeaB [Anaerolineales bacterium]
MNELLERVLAGQPRAVARLLTLVENSEVAAQTAVSHLYPHTGNAHIVGITGPPGAGKSSLVTVLAKTLRRQGFRLGIIAVDPSSPFTGGALLGDRVRMRDLAGDRGVFIRSMASRGSLGGLARATSAAVKVLDAAGYDKILLETVGAGQAEVDVASAAHTTLVIEAPGMGDDVQSIKAGILEIADILVVNKADKPGADHTVKSLEMMLHLGPLGGTRHHGRVVAAPQMVAEKAKDAWQIPVLRTVATAEEGIERLAEQVVAHRAHLLATGQWLVRERARSEREVERLMQDRLLARLQTAVLPAEREGLLTAVVQRQLDPYTAADQLMALVLRNED